MRTEKRPYYIKALKESITKFYVEWRLRPQFDELGGYYNFMSPWYVEVFGQGITLGKCATVVASFDRHTRFSVWGKDEDAPGTITIGDYALITPGVRISARNEIRIGHSVMIANSVYITDCEHPEGTLNPNVLSIAKGCDILIHDSHFSINDLSKHKGWGHSSWKQAVDVAITSEAKQLILFHHSPDYDDSQVELNEKTSTINTIASYQGLSISL